MRNALSWLLLGGLLWALFQLVKPFLDALAWAGVFAIFFAPAHRWLLRHGSTPNKAAFFSTLCVTLVMIVPTFLVVQAVTLEAIGLFNESSNVVPRLWDFLHKLESRIPWDVLPADALQQVINEVSGWAKANLGQLSARFASNLAQVFFQLSVIVFALFYCFRDGAHFLRTLGRLSVLRDDLRERLYEEVASTVQSTVSATLLVSALQGFLGSLIFLALGLSSPVLWGVVLGVASLIPVFGTAMIWAPQGIWLIVNGAFWKGVILLTFGALVISSVDNVLRPFLITGKSPVNTLLVFIGVIGGLQAFGAVGAILGPVIIGVTAGLLRAYEEVEEIKEAEVDSKVEPTPAAEPTAS